MSDGAAKRRSEFDENKGWGEVERQENCCFPKQSFKNLIQALNMNKF